MRAIGVLWAVLMAASLSEAAWAEVSQRDHWKADGWYGYTDFDNDGFLGCSAWFDKEKKTAVLLDRSRSAKGSMLSLYDENDGVDLRKVADEGAHVIVTIGSTQREYEVVDAYSMFMGVNPQPDILQLLAAGGTFSLKLPNGKVVYTNRLPAAPAAMANYRKCLESHQLSVN
jgi:hypothetical protein